MENNKRKQAMVIFAMILLPVFLFSSCGTGKTSEITLISDRQQTGEK